MQTLPLIVEARKRREMSDKQITDIIKKVQREIAYGGGKRPKNKLSFQQFSEVRRQIKNVLDEARAPPEVTIEVLEVHHNKIICALNCSREGKAVCVVQKPDKTVPTMKVMGKLARGKGGKPHFSVVDTLKDDDVIVEINTLHALTEYV